MWYYSRDGKEKQGPISDAAVAVYYKRRQIDRTTQMWSPKQKKWLPLEQTSIYKKIRKGRTSQHFVDLQNNTRFLRAFLTSLLICICATIYYRYNNILEYINFIDNGSVMDKVDMMIKSTENALTEKLISTVLLILFIFSTYFLYKWVKSSVLNAKLFVKRFSFTPNFSALSFVIPFLNIFIPHKILSETFRSTLKSLKKRVRVRYILLLLTWQIYWSMSFFMLVIAQFILPTTGQTDLFMPLFVIRILFNITYAITIILTLMVITILYNLQRKRLALYK